MRKLMQKIPAFFLALVLFVPAALSQSLPPPPGEPKPFDLTEPTIFELDNGLKVTFVDFGNVPKVSIAIVVQAGNINDGGDTWLADVTGELMKDGTTNRSAYDLTVQAAEMGGGFSIQVSQDFTMLVIDVLSEYAPLGLTLLGDVLRNPLLAESELPAVKQNFQRNLAVSLSQPRSIAAEAFFGMLYGDHPYGVIFPTSEQLSGYTIDQVKGFYEDNFGAARTHVYVAGKFDHDAMKQAINKAFGDWAAGPAPLDLPVTTSGAFRVKLIDRPGSEQSTVYLGLPIITITNPDYVPFQVMHTLLGGSFASRITQNIREDKGYTYSPRASIGHRKDTAYWLEVADITTDVTGDALQQIFYEIERLQQNQPSADELKRTQNYRAGIFVLQNGSRGGIIGQLAALNLQGLDSSFLNDYTGRVFAVTEEDISALAGEHLPLDQMTLVVVGDMSVIEEQIRALPELADAEYLE